MKKNRNKNNHNNKTFIIKNIINGNNYINKFNKFLKIKIKIVQYIKL